MLQYLHFKALVFLLLFPVALNAADKDYSSNQNKVISCRSSHIPVQYKKYCVLPWEMQHFPEFANGYKKITLPGKDYRWLQTLNVVGDTNSFYLTKDNHYLIIISGCKIRACDENAIRLVFDPRSHEVFGLLEEPKQKQFLGNPPPAIQSILVIPIYNLIHNH